jgi:hypothetical protein
VIERPDRLVVDGLLEAGLTVVVISPNQLKNPRSRYGQAGNKDDRFDAFVLADTLRTQSAAAGADPVWPASPRRPVSRARPVSWVSLGRGPQLRDVLVEWAVDSRLSDHWAADIYRRARARGHDHPDAVHVLARAWVFVLWRCWQDGTAYDPDRHASLQRLTPSDEPRAA